MRTGNIKYIREIVGELDTNSYILYSEESRESLLIDPGAEGEKLLRRIDERGLKLKKIVLTHGHIDHCGDVNTILSVKKIPLLMHREDLTVLNSHINTDLGRSLGLTPPKRADEFINEGDIIEISGLKVEVLHTPGHSPGSICLKCGDLLFTGDTLFAGSIGRTDLPGGDFKTINKSLERIKQIDENMIILPGHGDESDMKTELAINPFL